MRCKVFTVSLDSQTALEQQRKIESFMDANNVKRIFASFASQPEGPIWSVLFFYEGGDSGIRQTSAGPSVAAGSDRPMPNRSMGPGVTLNPTEVKSVIALKRWRAEAAAQEGVPVYMVAQNRWLEEMVRIPVRTLDDLKKVAGFSEWRVQKYGPRIVEILNTGSSLRRTWPNPPYSAGRA